jgi:hypothetical protein
MSSCDRRCSAACILCAGMLLHGCADRPLVPHGEGLAVPPVPQAWLAGAAEAVPLDRGRSRIDVRVYREGRLARLGHNHVVEVADLDGELWTLSSGGGVAQLRFHPQQMRVDDPAARARAGDAFSPVPDSGAVEGTRRNMLGPQVLDAGTWPEVQVLARIDDLDAAESEAQVQVTLRGVARRYRAPVSVTSVRGQILVSGSLQLKQSDFGITPFSVMGGALQVRDLVDVDFRVAGRVSDRAL